VTRRLGTAVCRLAVAAALAAATALFAAGTGRGEIGAGVGRAGGAQPAGSAGGYDPGAVAAGRKLYLRHCAECHGGDARGGPRAPSLDTRRVGEAAPGDLFWFLTNGSLRAGMPAWSRLPAAQRWQLTAYLKALGGAAAR
jgi:mono/diheme cytochrome c family protein